jgi:hypothetical protein
MQFKLTVNKFSGILLRSKACCVPSSTLVWPVCTDSGKNNFSRSMPSLVRQGMFDTCNIICTYFLTIVGVWTLQVFFQWYCSLNFWLQGSSKSIELFWRWVLNIILNSVGDTSCRPSSGHHLELLMYVRTNSQGHQRSLSGLPYKCSINPRANPRTTESTHMHNASVEVGM